MNKFICETCNKPFPNAYWKENHQQTKPHMENLKMKRSLKKSQDGGGITQYVTGLVNHLMDDDETPKATLPDYVAGLVKYTMDNDQTTDKPETKIPKMYPCDTCQSMFTTKFNRDRHIAKNCSINKSPKDENMKPPKDEHMKTPPTLETENVGKEENALPNPIMGTLKIPCVVFFA